jgi:hypothetical protein
VSVLLISARLAHAYANQLEFVTLCKLGSPDFSASRGRSNGGSGPHVPSIRWLTGPGLPMAKAGVQEKKLHCLNVLQASAGMTL